MLDGPANLALTDDEIDYLDISEAEHRRQMERGSAMLLSAITGIPIEEEPLPPPRPILPPPLPPPPPVPASRRQCHPVADHIIRKVAMIFGVTAARIKGDERYAALVDARAAVVFILMRRGWSFNQIGKALGGRDHTTICNIWNKRDIYTMRSKPLQDCMERLGHLAKKGIL